MPVFQYSCVDQSGRNTDGTIEAVDRKAAVMTLKSRGMFATALQEKRLADTAKSSSASVAVKTKSQSVSGSSTIEGKLSRREQLDFTNQLHTALKSGLPLSKCLEIVAAQMPRESSKAVVEGLLADVASGKSFSQAIADSSHDFPVLYSSMVRAGETGGILEKTIGQLQDLLKREFKLVSSIKTAMAYPILVLCFGLVSVILLLTVVMPRIIYSMTDSVALLPWPTRFLMNVGDFFSSISGLVFFIVLGIAFVAAHLWLKTDNGRYFRDSLLLKIPLFSNLLKAISVGRFCRTFGSLVSGGVVILDALDVVKETLGNVVLAAKMDKVIEDVKAGSSLAEPLEQAGDMPQLLIQIVAVGEQTGKLDEMLLDAGETFEEKADIAIERFTNILPTIIIILLAVLIFFIVMATLMPVMTMDFGV